MADQVGSPSHSRNVLQTFHIGGSPSLKAGEGQEPAKLLARCPSFKEQQQDAEKQAARPASYRAPARYVVGAGMTSADMERKEMRPKVHVEPARPTSLMGPPSELDQDPKKHGVKIIPREASKDDSDFIAKIPHSKVERARKLLSSTVFSTAAETLPPPPKRCLKHVEQTKPKEYQIPVNRGYKVLPPWNTDDE